MIAMNDLMIDPTTSTPKVEFKSNGELNMEGRSLPEDTARFYDPIIKWAKGFHAKQIVFNIKLEYLNTSSSKQLLTILKTISDNPSNTDVTINWYYEEGDLDSLETGEHFASIVKAPFKFIEFAETESF
ncbi:MAG: DUF1987 domain-containing protein [Bacteroidales bacterium]|nr:DUF1987 domain-containing protein [Bacteroidales bacterium]